jgi:hypothetical protein
MRILFALLTLGVGIALLAGGYRLARFVIPLWGFIAGLSVGGSIISSMAGTPFLGTAMGIIVGLILGIVFAALSYMFYSIAVVVLIGAAGFWAGSSFVQLFGFDPGILSALVGLALGIMVAIVALTLNAPKYALIIFTAAVGAMTAVGGMLLLFNKVPLDQFSYNAVNQSIADSFLWTLLALVLAGVSIAFQIRTTIRYSFEAWTMASFGDGGEGHPMPPTPTTTAGVH